MKKAILIVSLVLMLGVISGCVTTTQQGSATGFATNTYTPPPDFGYAGQVQSQPVQGGMQGGGYAVHSGGAVGCGI